MRYLLHQLLLLDLRVVLSLHLHQRQLPDLLVGQQLSEVHQELSSAEERSLAPDQESPSAVLQLVALWLHHRQQAPLEWVEQQS